MVGARLGGVSQGARRDEIESAAARPEARCTRVLTAWRITASLATRVTFFRARVTAV